MFAVALLNLIKEGYSGVLASLLAIQRRGVYAGQDAPGTMPLSGLVPSGSE
jgi:hypothetical protein